MFYIVKLNLLFYNFNDFLISFSSRQIISDEIGKSIGCRGDYPAKGLFQLQKLGYIGIAICCGQIPTKVGTEQKNCRLIEFMVKINFGFVALEFPLEWS
jgi:hypothetical protein